MQSKRKRKNFSETTDAQVSPSLILNASSVVAFDVLDDIEVPRGQQLTLLSSGGAVIPRKPDWTLGPYIRQMHKGRTQLRIGIEVIKKV